MTKNPGLDNWHAYLEDKQDDALLNLISDDATFTSPVVHTPQKGKPLVFAYLSAANHVFSDSNFRYVDKIVQANGTKAMMEFTAEIDDIQINGVDIIHWNEAGKIERFKVMVRPLQGMNKLWEKMGEMLAQSKAS